MSKSEKNPSEATKMEWIKETKDSEISSNEREIIEIQQTNFDYSVVDTKTKEYLIKQEIKIVNILNKAYTNLGKVLFESQKKLAKSGYGCFLDWVSSLGMKKSKVYGLMDRYKLLIKLPETQRKVVEELPISLAYVISRKNVDQELKERVLNGKIKTLKELKSVKKQKEVLDPETYRTIIIKEMKVVIKANKNKSNVAMANAIYDHFRIYLKSN